MPETERSPEQEGEEQGITSPPPEDANQSTTPPGNPPVDKDAVRKSEDGLEQAGGGH